MRTWATGPIGLIPQNESGSLHADVGDRSKFGRASKIYQVAPCGRGRQRNLSGHPDKFNGRSMRTWATVQIGKIFRFGNRSLHAAVGDSLRA